MGYSYPKERIKHLPEIFESRILKRWHLLDGCISLQRSSQPGEVGRQSLTNPTDVSSHKDRYMLC